MKRIPAIIAILIIIAFLIGIPVAAWFGVTTVLDWISSQESQVAGAIIAAGATVFAGLGAVVFSQQRTKTREIAEAHRPKKIDLYTRFIKKVMHVIHNHDASRPKNALVADEELRKFFHDFTTDLALWGSAGVIRAYGKFKRVSEATGSATTVLAMDDLIRAMRKDLGHSDWLLQQGEVIKTFLRDPTELDKAK